MGPRGGGPESPHKHLADSRSGGGDETINGDNKHDSFRELWCKTPDGQHIYGDNGRCLIYWQMNGNSEGVSRVLAIMISGESPDRQQVDRIAEIIEGQVRGIFATVELIETESLVWLPFRGPPERSRVTFRRIM
jgi:hypothetical protein